MTRNTLAIATLAAMLFMGGLAIFVATGTPPGQQLPTHWGLDGNPDDWSDKWTALLMPIGLIAVVSLLFYFMPKLEPRKRGLERSQGLYLAAWAGMLLIGILIELAVASYAFDWGIDGPRFILVGVGAMFVLIGNQLGKSRSMYLIGIRTPWTLASEEVWIKTHRLGGKLFVFGGLLMIVAAFLPLPPAMTAILVIGVLAVAVGVPLVYSFVLWRRERSAAQPSE